MQRVTGSTYHEVNDGTRGCRCDLGFLITMHASFDIRTSGPEITMHVETTMHAWGGDRGAHCGGRHEDGGERLLERVRPRLPQGQRHPRTWRINVQHHTLDPLSCEKIRIQTRLISLQVENKSLLEPVVIVIIVGLEDTSTQDKSCGEYRGACAGHCGNTRHSQLRYRALGNSKLYV
jgi:hypothetical protein